MGSLATCYVCLDDEPYTLSDSETPFTRMPCGTHTLCINCLGDAVGMATTGESLYPVKCCGSRGLELEEVEEELDNHPDRFSQVLERFQQKFTEFETSPDLRRYCGSRECCIARGESRFLDPNLYGNGKTIVCPDCDSMVCITCKELIEDPEDEHKCKDDEHDEQIRELIASLPADERWLWQRCYLCRRWVEKTEACNHMTCKCSAEFCLLCGDPYNDRSQRCMTDCPSYGPPLYDEEGFDQHGYDRDGYDRRGRDQAGLNRLGLTAHHTTPGGHSIEAGYERGPDGNTRRSVPDAPPAQVSRCTHVVYRCDVEDDMPGTCMCCLWKARLFVFACELCPMRACRSCVTSGFESGGEAMRRLYPFFEDESFELWRLFEDEEDTKPMDGVIEAHEQGFFGNDEAEQLQDSGDGDTSRMV